MNVRISNSLAPETFREYLLILARAQVVRGRDSKLDASDVVQQTLLEAVRIRDKFHGTDPAEMAAWLRQILANTMLRNWRDLGRAKRDPGREQALQQDLDASSAGLEAWLAADCSSPSARVDRHERLLRLASALAKLPEEQREALVLRYCRNWKLAEIARHQGCSSPTVIERIQRGFDRVRALVPELK